MSDIDFLICGTFVWVVWKSEVLPSGRWNANGKPQTGNSGVTRFDFELLVCNPVQVSRLFPPTAKPCRTSVFESAGLSSVLCGGRKFCPQEDEMPTGRCKLEIRVSRRVDFAMLVWCGVVWCVSVSCCAVSAVWCDAVWCGLI